VAISLGSDSRLKELLPVFDCLNRWSRKYQSSSLIAVPGIWEAMPENSILTHFCIILPLPTNDFEKLCDRIFAADKNIRFAGVIDKMGMLVAGGMRKGIKPLEPREERRRLYIEYALRSAMRSDFDEEYGRTLYSMSEREKIKIATFPHGDHLVLISIERKAKHDKIIAKILKLLR
jgi:hypothetical protein